MADAALHFAVGMTVGTVAFLPAYAARMRTRAPMGSFVGRWICAIYGIGLLAVVPSAFDNIGIPGWLAGGWWMNVFVFHPLIEHVKPGGLVWGGFGIVGCFCFSYLLMLAALRRARGGKMAGTPV